MGSTPLFENTILVQYLHNKQNGYADNHMQVKRKRIKTKIFVTWILTENKIYGIKFNLIIILA